MSRFFLGPFGMGARKERELTLEMLNVSPGDRVLDVGCGPGNYTRYLAAASGDGLVVGVDASESMLATGARHAGNSNIAYVRADACALPFADAAFDSVCCVGALHMTQDPIAALEEMTRVLAPAGRMVIVTTCSPKDGPASTRNGITMFARKELPAMLAARDLVEIKQRVFGRAQFLSLRRPAE
jgi:ubiquinone/menaquinone biosynthesis C-methylase UbiE